MMSADDMDKEQQIFRRGSTTYYFSTAFFPEPVRSDVLRLYSFVCTADNYVDKQPAQPEKLFALENRWHEAWKDAAFSTTPDDDDIATRVLKNMVYVARTYAFDPQWVDDFFAAMKTDINPQPFQTIEDVLDYIHGSAEVIGLMMAKMLGLPDKAAYAAVLQGRAMQYINFIRDIAEDTDVGRCYFPVEDLKTFNIKALTVECASRDPDAFYDFMQFQLKRYDQWQDEAVEGFRYIPKRYRIAIRTAVDMYGWTANQIAKDPFVVFSRTIKPSKWRVMGQALYRALHG
jgi:phytoene synthase